MRGILVSYEAIRKKSGSLDSNMLTSCGVGATRSGDKWHAMDQDGHLLDILVQRHRDKTAAKTFFWKLLKGCQHVQRAIVTEKLKSYSTAKREMLPG